MAHFLPCSLAGLGRAGEHIISTCAWRSCSCPVHPRFGQMKGTKQNSCVGTKPAWLGRTGIRRECEFLKATSAAKDIAPETDRGTRCSMPANSIFAFQFERTVGSRSQTVGPGRLRGG